MEKHCNKIGPDQSNFYWGPESININHPQGNYYRGFFRGPNYWNMDFSLFKEVRIPWVTPDGARLQIRLEAFNLFNHTNFDPSGLSTITGNYSMGYVLDAYPNRQIQMGFKFIF